MQRSTSQKSDKKKKSLFLAKSAAKFLNIKHEDDLRERVSQAEYDRFRQFIQPQKKVDVKLTDSQAEHAKQLFENLDIDQSGEIGRGELLEIFIEIGLNRKIDQFQKGGGTGTSGPAKPREPSSDEIDPWVAAPDEHKISLAESQRRRKIILKDKGYQNFQTFVRQAFDSYYEGGVSNELSYPSFLQLYQALYQSWPWAVEVPRNIVDRVEGVRDLHLKESSKAVNAAQEAAKGYALMSLDDQALLRIFNLFDEDKSGYLDSREITLIAREMGIPDYERDGYKGFIRRNARLVDANGSGEIEFEEFKVLIQSLVTSKVDRAYREHILKQRLPTDINKSISLEDTKSKKKEKGRGNRFLQAMGKNGMK